MVALSVALGVVGGAGVDAAVGARHLLQHETLVRDDHLLRHVVAQLTALQIGLLIFAFYFTSKILLYYQHLLVNMEQCSKKDLDSEQVQIS